MTMSLSYDRLRDLFEHAHRSVPYYTKLLNSVSSLTPEECNAFLSGLPLLTRQILREDGVRLLAQQGDRSGWRMLRTTGTTDEPAEVTIDIESQQADALALEQHIDRCIGGTDWRERALFHIALHADASSRAQPASWHQEGLTVKWNLLRVWQTDDATFASAMSHLNGHVVSTMPSVLEMIARRLQAGSFAAPRPILILLAGQVIEAEHRALINDVFRCPMSSLYTMAEAGLVGTECPFGGYHVQDDKVIVEVVTADGMRLPSEQEGDIVVTPLMNRAMPLIRYSTGDRGRWLEAACHCGCSSRRLCLTVGRRPNRLITASGATVSVVRFAKILASLDVHQFAFAQDSSGTVQVSYLADKSLVGAERALVEGAVRTGLGPKLQIHLKHVAIIDPKDFQAQSITVCLLHKSEPAWPDIDELLQWLREEITDEANLEAALLTGSILEPEAATRFSDIDLVLLYRDDFDEHHWFDLARRLRGKINRLSVHPQRLDRLEQRSPLLACRLLSEQAMVLGKLDERIVSWPIKEDLRVEGRFWIDGAMVIVRQRLVEYDGRPFDPVREGWMSSKIALTALRYEVLIDGGKVTSAHAVLTNIHKTAFILGAWSDDLVEALQVAREHRPPPVASPRLFLRYWFATLAYLRFVKNRLDEL